MNNYAKTVLWLGLFMIVAGIIVNWSVISATIFGAAGSGQYGSPTGPGIPGPGGIPPNPKTHKCPPGYISAFGRCWSPAVNPIPPKVTQA